MTNARFIKLDAEGKALPAEAGDWSAVHDTKLNLQWTRNKLDKLRHKEAMQAPKELVLAGAKDWRPPTLEELESLRDIKRWQPAVDTTFFSFEPDDWFWTSDVDAWAPEDFAWGVNFKYGNAAPTNSASMAASWRCGRCRRSNSHEQVHSDAR